AHFAKYIEAGIEVGEMEDLFKGVHEKIRAAPVVPKKVRTKPAEAKIWQPLKISYEERKERLKAKLATLME
ncbi:hypothetical protein FOA52_005444, partial [Chlamydomonas sp. UWO 241]